ncbi:MAG TPA: hypothetical protein PKM21_09835 [Anaerolineales bacterium]|nr:hypothetical protein [Anaerolineales bacterium]
MSDKYTWEQLPEEFRQAVAEHPAYQGMIPNWNSQPLERREEIYTRFVKQKRQTRILVGIGFFCALVITFIWFLVTR